jgi:NADPH-dependent 2,4-dienoyl-CoA reductase/sulfur reductase-like enzyme
MKHFDLIVVGAGPAGITAATAAARCGCRVLLLDDNHAPGGQIWRSGTTASTKAPTNAPRNAALRRLAACGARLLTGYRVFDAPSPGVLQAFTESPEPGQPALETLQYDKLILATGARERFLPFPGWTLPGVFGPGGLQALVKGGFNVCNKRIAIAGSGPLLLAVAAHLREDGATITSIAEQASTLQLLPFAASLLTHPGKLLEGIKLRAALSGVPYRTGTWPVAALADANGQLTAVRLTNGTSTWDEPCDLLACGFHLVPNTELPSLLGCSLTNGFVAVNPQQQTSIPNIFCVGEPTGIGGLDAALIQGEIAGLAAAGKPTTSLASRAASTRRFTARLARAFRLRPELRTLAAPDTPEGPGAIVCRCEDVPYSALATRTGWTDAKLQTRCGMGPCQGRICGPAVETLFGWTPKSVRPPLTPVPVSVLFPQTSEPEAPQVSTSSLIQGEVAK